MVFHKKNVNEKFIFNPLTTNVSIIETSQLICPANQMDGFYMGGTLVFKELS